MWSNQRRKMSITLAFKKEKKVKEKNSTRISTSVQRSHAMHQVIQYKSNVTCYAPIKSKTNCSWNCLLSFQHEVMAPSSRIDCLAELERGNFEEFYIGKWQKVSDDSSFRRRKFIKKIIDGNRFSTNFDIYLR